MPGDKNMEARRYIKKIESSQLIIENLDSFNGQEVEVIILPSSSSVVKENEALSTGKYHGILDIPEDELKQELSVLRDEWDRI